ncbi:hypothetical protein FACS1894151_09220 [Spirochaetia bacterium]|nr:hypothetical protein FACS1894151_09220 [Spirochaetia bacterium]
MREGTVATPTASPDAGKIGLNETVTLSTLTAGAEIWYTIDGNTPRVNGASSVKYESPVIITVAVTIKAIAVKAGMYDSDVLEAAYTLAVGAPTADHAAGEVIKNSIIKLSSSTEGAEIWYTTNGADPAKDDTGSTKYTTAGISVTSAVTIKAIAVKTGMVDSRIETFEYTIAKVAVPVILPASGKIAEEQDITITSATEGAEIWYTTNGTDPAKDGTDSTQYTAAFHTDVAITLRAIAVKTGYDDSDIASAEYTISAAKPTADKPAGVIDKGATVSLNTTTSGAAIRYTTDSSDPTSDSTLYTIPIVISASTTIKAIAVKEGVQDSDILTVEYTVLTAAAPTASLAEGTVIVTDSSTVSLNTGTAGAAIYYTTNGSNPTSSSTLYTSPILIDKTMTIKAFAVSAATLDSEMLSVTYTAKAAAPVASPGEGQVSKGASITLTTATTGATIYYTDDGTTPSAGSTPYASNPITIDLLLSTDSKTIKAIAVMTNGDASEVLTAVYTNPAKSYVITFESPNFVAKENGSTWDGSTQTNFQTLINSIRAKVGGDTCSIQFGDGTNPLDIVSAYANFNNTGGTWGTVSLSGKITSNLSSTTAGTITIGEGISLTSTADIESTGTGYAVYHNSSGDVTIAGGEVKGVSASAIYLNSSTGTLNISGGTVSSSIINNGALRNGSTGTVNISGGEVKNTGGGYGVSNDGAGTVNISGGEVKSTGLGVYNRSTGTVNISGGTVSAAGCAVANFLATGKITVSGTALITSAMSHATSGTILLAAGDVAYESLVISGGTVRNTAAANGNAVYSVGSAKITLLGGLVEVTGTTSCIAVHTSNGPIAISGNAKIIAPVVTDCYAFYNVGSASLVTFSGYSWQVTGNLFHVTLPY